MHDFDDFKTRFFKVANNVTLACENEMVRKIEFGRHVAAVAKIGQVRKDMDQGHEVKAFRDRIQVSLTNLKFEILSIFRLGDHWLHPLNKSPVTRPYVETFHERRLPMTFRPPGTSE